MGDLLALIRPPSVLVLHIRQECARERGTDTGHCRRARSIGKHVAGGAPEALDARFQSPVAVSKSAIPRRLFTVIVLQFAKWVAN